MAAPEMGMVPAEVGVASRAWDEQHLDLVAAAGQVGDAPTSGFSSAVSSSAAEFVAAWRGHVTTAADLAEGRADGLRATIVDWLATDRQISQDTLLLSTYVREQR